jgi:hypothetical protein
MNVIVLIAVSLMIVAFLYASVGHGGASGYIAVMSLFNVSVHTYKPIVLILNIVIAGIAFSQFYRAGFFRWSKCWPFLISGIPFAFLGSRMSIEGRIYNLMLGVALIFPIIRLLGGNPDERKVMKEMRFGLAILFVGVLGFAAGMVNIGWGIFFMPVFVFICWVKEN